MLAPRSASRPAIAADRDRQQRCPEDGHVEPRRPCGGALSPVPATHVTLQPEPRPAACAAAITAPSSGPGGDEDRQGEVAADDHLLDVQHLDPGHGERPRRPRTSRRAGRDRSP